jgi:hypothetical protein
MSRASKLAELRALRASGKTRLSTYEVAEEEQLYDEVDEEGYKKVVRGRLEEDDFIVDDNGEGYADDGREEWDNADRPGYHYATESEDEERPAKGKAGIYCVLYLTKFTNLYQPNESARKTRRSGIIRTEKSTRSLPSRPRPRLRNQR